MNFNFLDRKLKRTNLNKRRPINVNPTSHLAIHIYHARRSPIKDSKSSTTLQQLPTFFLANQQSTNKMIKNKKKILLDLIEEEGWDNKMPITYKTGNKSSEETTRKKLTAKALMELEFHIRCSEAIQHERQHFLVGSPVASSVKSISNSSDTSYSSTVNLEEEFKGPNNEDSDSESDIDIADEDARRLPILTHITHLTSLVLINQIQGRELCLEDTNIAGKIIDKSDEITNTPQHNKNESKSRCNDQNVSREPKSTSQHHFGRPIIRKKAQKLLNF